MDDEAFETLLEDQWPHQRFTLPRFWNDPKLNAPNQPVVGICWFEVRAYCAWLSAQTGQHYRLLTEAEWEAAASGKVGRRYPWGDAFDATMCNTIETRLRRVTPVGVFPASDTPSPVSGAGIMDMPGNVWEWTGSYYQAYPYQAGDGREAVDGDNIPRVLRGGSWFNFGWFCRSAYRNLIVPSLRFHNTGFRLARGH
ncbi:MAG: formylglycine-generating enzyme family protein [Burkholderiales bacterium]|nr:formylglycine-generating enzyme family protein [Burkholderiales bacterium]